MKLFISDTDKYIGRAFTQVAQSSSDHEIVTDVDQVLDADVLLLNVLHGFHEARDIITQLSKLPDDDQRDRFVVLVSTLNTWGESDPMLMGDPAEDGDSPSQLLDANYSKRKPSAEYIEHHRLENMLINMAHDHLSTYVLGVGVLYGQGENELHHLFRDCWLGDQLRLPEFEKSQLFNQPSLPMMHVLDVARVAFRVLEQTPNQPYIVCTDRATDTLEKVEYAIQKALQPHKSSDALLNYLSKPQTDELILSQPHWNVLKLQLEFSEDSLRCVGDLLDSDWTCEGGLVQHIDQVVREFRTTRDLRPLKLTVLGAPCMGKTTLCERLAKEYYLPVVDMSQVVETVMQLEPPAAVETEDDDDLALDGGDEDEAEEKQPSLFERIREATQAKKSTGITPELFGEAFRYLINSDSKFTNQGFVLDNIEAKSAEELGSAFLGEPIVPSDDQDEGGEEEPVDAPREWDSALVLDGAVVVDNLDDEAALKDRYQVLVDKNVKEFEKKLKAYRAQVQKPGHDVAVFLRDHGIAVKDIELAAAAVEPQRAQVKTDEEFEALQETYTQKLEAFSSAEACADADVRAFVERDGKPFNYHPNEEELAEMKRKEEEEKRFKELELLRQKAEESLKAQKSKEEEEHESSYQRELEERKDEELMEERSRPLREYLMKHVMPVLTQGLLECCKEEPEDPVDFLAEYLFKQKVETRPVTRSSSMSRVPSQGRLSQS